LERRGVQVEGPAREGTPMTYVYEIVHGFCYGLGFAGAWWIVNKILNR
jgi:hypothetical protein